MNDLQRRIRAAIQVDPRVTEFRGQRDTFVFMRVVFKQVKSSDMSACRRIHFTAYRRLPGLDDSGIQSQVQHGVPWLRRGGADEPCTPHMNVVAPAASQRTVYENHLYVLFHRDRNYTMTVSPGKANADAAAP